MNYAAYLHSTHWRTLRQTIIRKRGARCEQCGRTRGIALHHLTYERLGNELEQDLLILCHRCHRDAHLPPWPRQRGTARPISPTAWPSPDFRKKKQRTRNPLPTSEANA